MQDQLLDMLMKEDEITWQTIIYDLIKSEKMNPWDVDISLLTKRYLETIRKLHELNFFVSGKVILASALLLRIKSHKLLTEDIVALDNLLYPSSEEEFHEELDDLYDNKNTNIPPLAIKSPQARKRKVTINDLIAALEKALDVNERRVLRHAERNRIPENLVIPQKPADITQIIKELYEKIKVVFTKKEILTFSELVPSDRKEDKIATFIPLLHLANQEKVDLNQQEHFGEIDIKLVNV